MSLDVVVSRLCVAGRLLVQGLSLQVPPGAVHTVMGESGCGKSTLIAVISGTAPAEVAFQGTVALAGRRVEGLSARERRIGILFQDDLLFAHMTVRENLLFAVPTGPRHEREAVVAQALLDLELPEYAHADPATLSGGQRSRVALMRALLAQPRALLLDEPFARLDAALRERMREFVFGVIRERNIPALLVSHDPQDIADRGRVTHMTQPAGGIASTGSSPD